MAAQPARSVDFSSVVRVGGMVLLAIGTLFHLQFAVQAIFQAPIQGVLALVATGALGLGTYRISRRQKASAIVFLGTVPLFLLHIPYTVLDPGEMPFLIGSAVVPALAGLAWIFRHWVTPQQERPSQ